MRKSLVIISLITLFDLCSGQIYGYINVFISGPIAIVVENSQGQRAGYDPRTNTYYEEIKGFAYGPAGMGSEIPGEPGINGWDFVSSKVINKSYQDNFKLTIIGVKSGSYQISAGMTRSLNKGEDFNFEGTIDSLEAIRYEFNYSTDTTKTLYFRKYEPPSGIPTFNVKLVNSQGQLLTGGSLQYYDGGWKAAVNNGDGTFLVEIERSTVSLRMSYEGGNETRQNVPIQGAVVTFKTVNSKVELHNSQNQLMPAPMGDEGSVQYYAGSWRDFGATAGGVALKELLPIQYSFRMTYAHASIDKQQDISSDPTVVFQTVNAQAELRDSNGNLMPAPMGDQGMVQYYAGAWREFGNTTGGVASMELLPKQYSFRMAYAYASIDKQQDISTDPVVSFATVLATVNVTGQQNQALNGAQVSYYSGAWRTIGETVNGSIARELLPRNYTFRAAYQGTSADLQQDISQNSTVNIQLNITGP